MDKTFIKYLAVAVALFVIIWYFVLNNGFAPLFDYSTTATSTLSEGSLGEPQESGLAVE